jgi:hypothetical protein
VSGRSGGKRREREHRRTAWGRICKRDRRRRVPVSEGRRSGARSGSGRGRACGGKHSGRKARVSSRSRYGGAGKFICSGGDRIRLGALPRSLPPSVWINIFAGALGFNSADALRGRVSTVRAVLPLWGFSNAHEFGRFGPGLLIWMEDILFRQRAGHVCRGDRRLQAKSDRFQGLELRG